MLEIVEYATIPLLAIACLIQRVIVGGWLGWNRSQAVALMAFILSIPCLLAPYVFGIHVPFTIFGYDVPEWARQLLTVGAAFWYITDGAYFERPWRLAYRYDNGPLIVAILYGFWPALLCGPLVAIADMVAHKWGGPVNTPLDTTINGNVERPIDGWGAYYEMAVGFFGALAFTLAPYFGSGTGWIDAIVKLF